MYQIKKKNTRFPIDGADQTLRILPGRCVFPVTREWPHSKEEEVFSGIACLDFFLNNY